jgi:hypothetical protein
VQVKAAVLQEEIDMPPRYRAGKLLVQLALGVSDQEADIGVSAILSCV